MALRWLAPTLLLSIGFLAQAESVEAWQFSTVRHVVQLEWEIQGDACFRVEGVLPMRRLVPERLPAASPPAEIIVELVAGPALGRVENRLIVNDCRSGITLIEVPLISFVQSVLDDERPLVDFGQVAPGSRAMIQLQLTTREPAGLRLVTVAPDPAIVDVELLPDGRTIALSLPPSSPWGLLGGVVDVEIDSELQSRVHIVWRAQRIGPLVARPEQLRLPEMRSGRAATVASVELRTVDGRVLEPALLQVVGVEARLQPRPCELPAADCLRVDLQALGSVSASGEMRVGLAGEEGWLRIPLQRQSLGGIGEARQQTPGFRHTSQTPSERLRQALSVGIEQDAPPGVGPVLSWRVRNEDAVFGYLVYRAERSDGPFVRVNPRIIRSDPARSGQYRWRDESADPGRVWYYAVEAISLQGRKSPLTGVLRREPER